jgi:6-phosphofructokinase 1
MKTIVVLCSGGDSPGMNCAVRGVVRTAIGRGIKVYGVLRGYAGLLEGAFQEMDASSVGNILQRGGTILQTSRCLEFHKEEIRKEAANILKRKKVDGLVVIGGDGSFNGAYALHKEHGIPVVGIPGTIDNDISGTEYTVGFDTAVQTAIDAVDKIRDTAHSHARTFIVEVMGRRSPAIAMHVGVCTGAENIILPTEEIDYKEIAADIHRGISRGKNSSIIITAEGEKPGLSYEVQKCLQEDYDISAHVCILGHIQRGGKPSSIDRFLASRMGFLSVQSLIDGNYPVVTGFIKGSVQPVPFEDCLGKKNEYLPEYLETIKALSI